MGTFTATHKITYQNGNFSSGGPQDVTIDDGEADTPFETGDTFFEPGFGFTYIYAGTAVVDGVTWPVFTFQGFPDFQSIFRTKLQLPHRQLWR